MDSKAVKTKIIQFVVCIGSLILIWGGYFLVMKYKINRIIEIRYNDYSWVYQVDSVEINDGKLVLKGFAFELNTDAKQSTYEIVLSDLESGKNYFPKMDYMQRKDVEEYFACGFNYLESGFVASIDEKKVKSGDYEVLLKLVGERDTYRTGIYISKGNVMYASPLEYQALDVEGTALNEVVKSGILRVYRPEFGVYVYQYDGSLYWVMDKNYDFVDGDTYVQYQLNTTQIDRLPEERLSNKWYWDNIGFRFSECEVFEMNTEKYRVAKKEIPDSYSISGIWTGNYINDWVWRQDFYPFYKFEE